jgi:hypothetical protein
MKRTHFHRVVARMVAGVWFCLPSLSHACSACMGDPNSKTASAMNAAVFLMIGFVGTMLASLGAFAFYLSRRTASPMAPHAAVEHDLNDPDDLS